MPWSRVAAVLAINLRASLWSLLLPSYSQKILSRTAVGLYRQSAYSLIGLEAYAGAHFMGGKLREQGHPVRLIPASSLNLTENPT